MKKRLNLKNLYAKFGKAVSSRLGVPAPKSPGCPKVQNFETFFCQLWMVFLAFWVIVPHQNFGFRFVHFLRTNSPSGRLDFTFFPHVSHFSKLGVNFRTQFLGFLAKKWKILKIFLKFFHFQVKNVEIHAQNKFQTHSSKIQNFTQKMKHSPFSKSRPRL